MKIYVVKPGDTVDHIAASYGVPVESIIYNNQLTFPYPLAVGQALLVPEEAPVAPDRSVWAGGYAYSYIKPDILESTLLYLSGLLIFSYGFTPDGTLIPPVNDDAFMRELALANDASPLLVLTPMDANGMFNNQLIHQVINDAAATKQLIGNLTNAVLKRSFAGVDLDFEYILPEDREPYVAFVKEVRSAINQLGYPLSVALAPKTRSDQPGVLYEGMDYAGLGQAADSVLLMTYEWGYTYGPPMAVAPIDQVRRVVEYAVSQIPSEKITLGIPNYGYDWTLPFVKGSSRAAAISLQRAVELAIENDVPIQFDPVSMSPFFHYFKDEREHEVWFEDVRSLQEKFDLIKEYDLRGAAYWQIMTLFLPNWILLADNFLIEKNESAA